MSGSGRTSSSLLSDAEAWLYRAATTRQLKPTDATRTAQIILQHRQAEELIVELVNWLRGYDLEHRELARLAVALRAASMPGPNENGHRHWSIADDLPPGRGSAFRKALNALFKHMRGQGDE